MKTNEEVQEIAVLTDEQINSLPKEAVKTVQALNKSLSNSHLQNFVPVVQKYIDLRDKALKLKMEKEEDGTITKDSISNYKEIKAEQRALNGLITSKIKLIKDPINAIRADIIDVEKTFKSESDKIKLAAEKEFEEYEKELTRLAEEKQKKKDAELLAKVEESNKAAEDAKNQMAKTTIYNKIKYEIIGEGISEKTSTALASANKNTLVALSEKLNNTTYDDAIEGLDISILDMEVQAELKERFVTVKNQSIQLIKEKVAAIDLESENMVLKAANPSANITEAAKQIDSVIPPAVPNIPSVPLPQTTRIVTVPYLLDEAKRLYNFASAMIAENPSCNPLIYDLRNSLSKFK